MRFTEEAGGFPMTTNQLVYHERVFDGARELGGMDKSYNKRRTIYNAYANATFSSGMFLNNSVG